MIESENLAAPLSRRVIVTKWAVMLTIAAVVLVSLLKGVSADPQTLYGYLGERLHNAGSTLINQFKMNTYLFWGPLLVLLLVERLLPVKQGQKTFTVGFYQDLIWFVTVPLFGAFMVWRFQGFFKGAYEHYVNFFTIDTLADLPLAVKVILAVLASDFLSWFSHLLKHKIKLFWHFHAVHHSQPEMNFMTDHRVHPVERMISFVIRFFPITLLELRHGVPLGIAWWLFTTWHVMFYHASIRSNYGILRYIFVTPQSHRVHHSCLPQHQDCNYGVIFSFWDRMFGTQYKGYDEYPDTGVLDPDFPVEKKSDPVSLLVTMWRQFVYPFKMIIRKGI